MFIKEPLENDIMSISTLIVAKLQSSMFFRKMALIVFYQQFIFCMHLKIVQLRIYTNHNFNFKYLCIMEKH